MSLSRGILQLLSLWRRFYTFIETENNSFACCSHGEQQPELWQFNLFSIFSHELWMNPATSKLWWLSSPGLHKSSCWCCRLCVNLQETRRRKIRLVFKGTRPANRSCSPGDRHQIDCCVLTAISCVHSGSESFMITIITFFCGECSSVAAPVT